MSTTHLRLVGTLCILVAKVLPGQTAAAPLQFEVVSVKLSEPLTPGLAQSPAFHIGTKISGTRVDIGRMRLIDLITEAHGMKQNQIVAPAWLKTTADSFDIAARMPAGATKEQVPLMIQAMLAERFKLVAHKETRERAGYALVTAKDGPKLLAAEPEPEAQSPATAVPAQEPLALNGRGGAAPQQPFAPSSDGTTTHYVNPRADMARLAAMLAPILDQPVVDMTGLNGYYKIALDISMDDMRRMLGAPPGMGGSSADAGPMDLASEPAGRSVFTSLRAMGLSLESRRIPVEVLVVERVEPRPTAN